MGKITLSNADDNYTSRHYYLDHETVTHLRTLMYLYRCDQNYVNLSHRIKKIVELHVHVHVDYLMLHVHVHVCTKYSCICTDSAVLTLWHPM